MYFLAAAAFAPFSRFLTSSSVQVDSEMLFNRWPNSRWIPAHVSHAKHENVTQMWLGPRSLHVKQVRLALLNPIWTLRIRFTSFSCALASVMFVKSCCNYLPDGMAYRVRNKGATMQTSKQAEAGSNSRREMHTCETLAANTRLGQEKKKYKRFVFYATGFAWR